LADSRFHETFLAWPRGKGPETGLSFKAASLSREAAVPTGGGREAKAKGGGVEARTVRRRKPEDGEDFEEASRAKRRFRKEPMRRRTAAKEKGNRPRIRRGRMPRPGFGPARGSPADLTRSLLLARGEPKER
jgi:hypothetical protein